MHTTPCTVRLHVSLFHFTFCSFVSSSSSLCITMLATCISKLHQQKFVKKIQLICSQQTTIYTFVSVSILIISLFHFHTAPDLWALRFAVALRPQRQYIHFHFHTALELWALRFAVALRPQRQYIHFHFHTAPELWALRFAVALRPQRQYIHFHFHTALELWALSFQRQSTFTQLLSPHSYCTRSLTSRQPHRSSRRWKQRPQKIQWMLYVPQR